MMKTSKRLDESSSEYYLGLCKKAREFSVGSDVLKAIFVQGLPTDYKKHIVLRRVNLLDDILKASFEFEQISEFVARSALEQVNSINADEIDILRRLKISKKDENKHNCNVTQIHP